jgi:hypothetical protein
MNNKIQEATDILKVVEGANKFKGAEEPSSVLRGKILPVRCYLSAIAYKHVMTLFALFCFTANLFSLLKLSKVIVEL